MAVVQSLLAGEILIALLLFKYDFPNCAVNECVRSFQLQNYVYSFK